MLSGLASWLSNKLSRPKTAPGPSREQVKRKKRARQELRLAREKLEKASKGFADARGSAGVGVHRIAPEILDSARKRLAGALQSLNDANEELRVANQDLRDYPLPDYLKAERKRGTVMIAVTGNTGTGKSSWVNSIRRLGPKDRGYAATGEGETTLEPTKYGFPSRTMPCVVWDLPGVGTTGYPQETYLRSLGIRHFDVVVVITDQRFTEAELLLLEELRHWKLPFFLVRNKIDVDVDKELAAEQQVLDDREFGDELDAGSRLQIRTETIKNVKDDLFALHSVRDAYCISTQKPFWTSYDFLRLEADLVEAIKAQRDKGKKKRFSLRTSSALWL